MLPKDFREVNRLDFQHYLIRQAIAGNYLAPLSQPEAILDIACGTGRWMHEMAIQFPRAKTTGIDITPLPNDELKSFPQNCSFQQCDILKGLPFAAQTFDFTHQRFLIFALPFSQWPFVIQEQLRVTRSGGWIELIDPDLLFNNRGPETTKLVNWIAQAGEKRGLDITIGRKLGSLMQAAGLVNITVQKVPIPLGNWGGRIGDFLAKDFSGAATKLKTLVTALAPVAPHDYHRTVYALLNENNHNHTTC